MPCGIQLLKGTGASHENEGNADCAYYCSGLAPMQLVAMTGLDAKEPHTDAAPSLLNHLMGMVDSAAVRLEQPSADAGSDCPIENKTIIDWAQNVITCDALL